MITTINKPNDETSTTGFGGDLSRSPGFFMSALPVDDDDIEDDDDIDDDDDLDEVDDIDIDEVDEPAEPVIEDADLDDDLDLDEDDEDEDEDDL
ncbi:MAG: hypothetical protein M3040_12190 [Bacteroidota bacterium]|nr:hypothetical protein [Bacteroidota bacterium]